MSANYQTSAFAGCPASRLTPAPPLGLGARLGALGPVATALLRGRELLERFGRRRRKRPAENGGSETPPPEDHPTNDRIWDDPELWMLMMH
jgi:hypothetical protein